MIRTGPPTNARTTTHDSVSHAAFDGIKALVNALGMGLVELGDRPRVWQAYALMALSDEEPEDRDLKRSKTVRCVSLDSYWI